MSQAVSEKTQSPETNEKKRRWRMSRRGFLIGLGVTGVGVAVGLKWGVPEGQLALARMLDNATAPGSIKASPLAWFELGPDGSKLYMPKVEMGQGVHTALKQIALEELDMPWDQLEVVSASTTHGLNDGFGTGGSTTVSSLFTPLREAAATLREMLKAEGAKLLGLSLAEVSVAEGKVFAMRDPSKSLSYADITSQVSNWQVPKKAPALKSLNEFKVIGQPMPRVDFASKLQGTAAYGYDMRLDGMLYGAVARGESIESKRLSAKEGSARSVPGVVDVVINDDIIGVVATSRAAARAGVKALEVTWQEHSGLDDAEILKLCTVKPAEGTVIQREGKVNSIFKNANTVISAEYRSPMAVHAHLEPQAALVDVKPDKVRAWISTQSPSAIAGQIAKALGRKKEEVDVTATYLGGGFGRRLNVEVAFEAAKL
ncbi:MAG: molybdopterin cofactor-binding domain-containing protein, partial [Deinococcales bacterium]